MNRRLELLEDASRESAAADVRAAWRALGDEEMAFLVVPHFHGREPRSRERAAEERARGIWPEELIARAVGYRDGMPDEELDRRMGELLEPVLRRRRAAVYPRVVGMKDGR